MKSYRKEELKSYLIGNIIVIFLFSFQFEKVALENKDYYNLIIMVLSSSLISAAIYSFVFVFDSVLPSNWKSVISTLKIHMPGETIWSDISMNTKNLRFSDDEVKEKYKTIYDNMPHDKKKSYGYQNSQWYRVYSRVQTSKKVELAQRDYLLCRDLNCSNLSILLFYFLFCFVLKLIKFSWLVIYYIIFLYVLLVIATRNKGQRFVKTVIAVDLKENI